MSWEAIFAGITLCYLVGGGVISYWIKAVTLNQKDLIHSQRILANDLRDITLKMSEDYVKKSDINNRLDKIDNILDRIFDKLESKQDKGQ
jgi:hypothetical protein